MQVSATKTLVKPPADTTILVTGGAGFIGSHTVVELLDAGYNVVVVDDLSNSSAKSIERVRMITNTVETIDIEPNDVVANSHEASNTTNTQNRDDVADRDSSDASATSAHNRLKFYELNILDKVALDHVFVENDIDAIIHFAGFKAVGESTQKPLEYYWNNIAGTLVLCDVARTHGVKSIVFSSSATVYGEPEFVPITEACPKHEATNPYGQTKSMLEQILTDIYVGDNEWNIVILRYFNPIGAHPSGLIGEDPNGIPNNLVPYVAQVAVGKLECVGVFGNDYPTPDGTGVRDYIHVVDLARGHVAALDWMAGRVGTGAPSGIGSIQGESAPDGGRRGVGIFNLGTGHGSSVLEVIQAFERACGRPVPYTIKPRRPGDIAENFAACDKARTELGWEARYDLARMCEDSWRWQSMNPEGYK